MRRAQEDDDLRARIARDLDAGREEPNTELAPPERSAAVDALLAQGGDALAQAVHLAQAGQREDALQMVSQALESDPDRADGWVLMAALSDSAIVAQSCLEQALNLRPGYEPAQSGLDWMRTNPGQIPAHLVDALAPSAMPPAAAPEIAPPVEVPPPAPEVPPVVEAPPAPAAPAEEPPAAPPPAVERKREGRPTTLKAPTEELRAARKRPGALPTKPAAPVEDDLRARIKRDLEREEPDTELAPPPPSAEVQALLTEGGDPVATAKTLAQAGRREDALQVLSQALETNPALVQAWVLMGALTDSVMIARASLEQALQVDPNNPEALDGLRWMDRHPGQTPTFILGEAQPSKVLPTVPPPPEEKELITAAKAIARKFEAELAGVGMDDLRARIARDLESEEPDTELAPPAASAEVEALLAEGGDPIEKAVRLAQIGRREDALQVLSRTLDTDPTLVPAWLLMGALTDNVTVARACLEQAMLLDPNNAEALDGLRWMDQHPGEVPAYLLGEAKPEAPSAEPKKPGPSPIQEAEELVAWGIAAIQEDKLEDAGAYLSRALELNPRSESAWLWLAAVVKTPAEVRDCLNRVLALNPNNQEALEGLRWLDQKAALEIEAAVIPAPAPPEVVAPPIPRVEEVPVAPPVEAPPVLKPPEEPAVEAPRPLITSIPLPGTPSTRPAAPPPSAPARPEIRPGVRYAPSRRLQQLQQMEPAERPARPTPAPPFEQPETPFPQRRGCRLPFLLALAAVFAVAMVVVLGGLAVGLASAAGLPLAIPAPTATPTREERLAQLWSQSETAVAQRDWATAVRLLREVQAVDPQRAGLAERLYLTHLSYGLALVAEDQFAEAIAQFDAALAVRPGDTAATQQRQLVVLYGEGRQRFDAEDWGTAAAKFAEVYALDPAYRDVPSRLYMARCRFGQELLAQGKAEAAIEQYRLALRTVPDGADATSGLKRAQALLPTPTPRPTPTPTPTPRQRITISISQQHFRAYQDDALAFDLVCSTGEPGRATRAGNFKVLDKIPMAYSSVWNLKMPWWLGIYWSGSTENGIHALPILSSGRILWAGFLGRPVSFGCIILDTADAKRVYDWVQIGTPVIITY